MNCNNKTNQDVLWLLWSLPWLQLFRSWTWQLPAHDQRGNTRTWFQRPLWPRGSWWSQSCPCSPPGLSLCTACHLQKCCYNTKFSYIIIQQSRVILGEIKTLLLPPDFDVVRQQPAVDGLGGVSHECPAFKAGFLEEPWQSSTVIQVETNERTRALEQ